MRRRPSSAALALAGLLVAAGCGSSSSSASCGPLLREELDPASGLHVLPNATDVEYASDPPTSGPHQPSPLPESPLDEPLTRPLQVGVVEAGGILLQYRPADIGDVDELGSAVDDPLLVVAPNPDLDDPIVLTAWTAKQSCSEFDAAAVEAFIDERRGEAPGSDG